jgi:hypothetical protein
MKKHLLAITTTLLLLFALAPFTAAGPPPWNRIKAVADTYEGHPWTDVDCSNQSPFSDTLTTRPLSIDSQNGEGDTIHYVLRIWVPEALIRECVAKILNHPNLPY